MINVSNEFKQLMKQRTDFKENAEITLSNGTVLTLSEKDFTVSNNCITDGSDTNGIPLGVAVCKSIQIELMNDDDRFSEYDFFGATIRLFLTFKLSNTTERIEKGTYTVLTPETYGTTVIITALDDMYKADAPYATNLSFPATLGILFLDACNTVDIQQGTTTFLNDDFVVESAPEDITFRQLFGYIAMMAGGNARISNTGRIEIISYNFSAFEKIRNSIDGGLFNPWNNGISLDGGDFTYNGGDIVDGGTFTDELDYHILYSWKNLKIDTDDVVITGIRCTYTNDNNDEKSVMYGQDGYVLQITNPLIAGKENDAVGLIGNIMVGGRFRQFSGDLVANPTCEFMDPAVLLDRKGNVFFSFLTDINFQFFGFTSIKNSAAPALRNSSQAYSDATKTLAEARKIVKNERKARERAVEKLAKDLEESSGLYETTVEQEDGSSIYYMHDKPTLEESKIVWKLTALAFGISTDGGKTYPYGFTVDGETITRLLYAEGINADYITSGEIIIGSENVAKGIRIIDQFGNTQQSWTPDGIDATGKFKTTGTNEWTLGQTKTVLEDGTLKFLEQNDLKMAFSLANFGEKNPNGGYYHNKIAQIISTSWLALCLGFLTDDRSQSNTYYILNNGLNPDGLEERHLFNGLVRFLSTPRMSGLHLMPSNTAKDESEFVKLYESSYDGQPSVMSSGGIYAYGSIGCSGTKYRVVDTEHYGKVGMNAFETTEPYFSDIGSGIIGEDGTCAVEFDPIFSETIETGIEYRVQLTQTSEKNTSWVEKRESSFIVHGETGATFDWMLMCKQKGYADMRMQRITIQDKQEREEREDEN